MNEKDFVSKLSSLDPADWNKYAVDAESLFVFLHELLKNKKIVDVENIIVCALANSDINEYALLFLVDCLFEHRHVLKNWSELRSLYQSKSTNPINIWY